MTKNIMDLAKHIVNQKSGRFEPDKFENHDETALVDLINSKRSGKPIVPKERPRGRECRRSHGRVAQERRRRGGRDQGAEEVGQEALKGDGWSEGDADAEPGQVPREGASGQAAAEVGVGPRPQYAWARLIASNFRFRQHREHQRTCCWLDSVAFDQKRSSRSRCGASRGCPRLDRVC